MTQSAQTGFDRLKDDKGLQDHWVKRVIAYIIDVAIVSVALYFALLVVALPALPAVFSGQTFPLAWFWGFWLGGKELMGLKVVRLDSKRLDLWSSFVRNISKLAFLLLIIDVAVGLGTRGDSRQKYSDRYIGTIVEATNNTRIIPDRL